MTLLERRIFDQTSLTAPRPPSSDNSWNAVATMVCHGGRQRDDAAMECHGVPWSAMEACGEKNNVNRPTSIRSSGEAQLMENSPWKMLEERRLRQRGRDTLLMWSENPVGVERCCTPRRTAGW